MTDLIATLEGLTEPSREVDALVMQECFPDWATIGAPYLSPQCIGDEPIYWHAPRGSAYQKMSVPELTASLDAAIALVERVLPGWKWAVSTDYDRHHLDHLCHAHVMERILPHPDADYNDYSDGHGSSPAIALLIALLKAKEAADGR